MPCMKDYTHDFSSLLFSIDVVMVMPCFFQGCLYEMETFLFAKPEFTYVRTMCKWPVDLFDFVSPVEKESL